MATARTTRKRVRIYTDGGCIGNPGPGGYGVVLLYDKPDKRVHCVEMSGGFRLTTNNRMELMAVIIGLRALRTPCDVQLFADSAYVVSQMNGRVPDRWVQNGWRNSDKRPVKNRDLWEQVIALCTTHNVRFNRVPGHAGNAENERCDELANRAARAIDLPADAGYEHEEKLLVT